MSNNNNPIQFPGKPAVPIIGQPCDVHSWFPTVVLVCNCEAKQPVVLIGFNNISHCPSCGRAFRLHGIQQDIRTGKPPHFDIDIPVMQPQASDAKPV